MQIAAQVCLLVILLSLLGCGGEMASESAQPAPDPLQAQALVATADAPGIGPAAEKHLELLLKQAQWASHGVLEYQLTFRAEAGSHEPVEMMLHVLDDQLVGAYQPETGAWVDPQAYEGLRSVADIFETVEGLIGAEPDSLSIVYDEEYGFPVRIDMDYRQDWQDDYYRWSFSDFTVIRQSDGSPATSGPSNYLTF